MCCYPPTIQPRRSSWSITRRLRMTLSSDQPIPRLSPRLSRMPASICDTMSCAAHHSRHEPDLQLLEKWSLRRQLRQSFKHLTSLILSSTDKLKIFPIGNAILFYDCDRCLLGLFPFHEYHPSIGWRFRPRPCAVTADIAAAGTPSLLVVTPSFRSMCSLDMVH